ncbi:hypothetical protein CCR75_007671 [Bremia lactucae]|uniref:Phosphatidylinositol-3,4,5-trisphosphate 3-phosphatase n=1 Tax=Bremia lactucae TaxID=4779 RepID=A0A976IEJ6_BRELC|nr:hypothetical protein CCR75_007671 [Bremia lactucae]
MKALRAAVSGSRVRFTQDGFDLDLTYITPRLIAMGYPASGVEKTYRNDITEVATFLNIRHPSSYRVYNLSERAYDYSKFEGRVSECGFPDHHPPPLQLLLDIINDMIEWVAKDSKNVLVVHCLAGKGRTGVVCSCFLLLMGYYGSVFKLRKEHELRELANSSIRDFWSARGQGVRFPSQALYIYYFLKVLRRMGRMPTQIPPLRPAKRMILRSIVINGVPDFEAPPRGGCTPFLQVLPAPSQFKQPQLLYNSSWQSPKFETYLADPYGSIMFEVNVELQGDVLVRCFHANTTNILGKHMIKMFHFSFNTDFFHNYSNLYRLPKIEVDEATGNSRYPENFQVVCHVEMLDSDGIPYPPRSDSLISIADRSSNIDDDETEQPGPQSTPQRRMTVPAPLPMHNTPRERQASVRTEEGTLTMQGWLFKQGGFVKNWKKRWFVACEGKLMYYHGMSDAKPLGTVNLRRVTVEMCEGYEVNARNKSLSFFKVIPPSASERTYYFGAESERELVNWVHALGAQSAYGLIDSRRPYGQSNSRHDRFSYQQDYSTYNFGTERQRHQSYHMGDYSRESGNMATSGFRSRPDPRSSQLGATELAFEVSKDDVEPNDARGATRPRRGTMNGFPGAVQRALARRSISLREKENNEGYRFTLTGASAARECVRAEPVADLTNTLSAVEQASLLQEVNGFETGIYIYSADELQEAAVLQKYMRETPGALNPTILRTTSTPPPESLSAQLSQYVEQKQMDEAEQLLTELVLLKFPRLVDAMDYDPLAFTRLIAGGDIATATKKDEIASLVKRSRSQRKSRKANCE